MFQGLVNSGDRLSRPDKTFLGRSSCVRFGAGDTAACLQGDSRPAVETSSAP